MESPQKKQKTNANPKNNTMTSTQKNFIFVTDAKFDDNCAAALLVLSVAQSGDPVTIRFIVTDVNDQDGGRMVLETILNEVLSLHNITSVTLEFARGELPNEDLVTKDDEGNEVRKVVDKIQKHEAGTFGVYGKCSEDAQWVDAHGWVDASFPYTLMVFAPYNGLHDVVYAPNVSATFLAYGYNSNESDCTIKQFKRMTNVTIMNNASPTVYPAVNGERVEGGRFKQDDTELWSTMALVSPKLAQMRFAALDDSKKFALKYTIKAFAKKGIDKELTLDNLLSEEVQKLAQGIVGDNLPSYLFRSVDQVARGVLDVEVTDGQHMALFLSGVKMSRVDLADLGNPYFDIQANPEGAFKCPVGLSLDDTRSATINLMRSYVLNLSSDLSTPKSNASVSSAVTSPVTMEVDQGGYVPEVPGEDYGELMHARLHNAPSTRVPAPSP